MDTSTIEGKIAVMRAYANGLPIQFANKSPVVVGGRQALGPWQDVNASAGPTWNWRHNDYRVEELNENEIAIISYRRTGTSGDYTPCMPFYSLEKALKHIKHLNENNHETVLKIFALVKRQDKNL